MNEQINFNEWWLEFEHQHRNEKDGGYERFIQLNNYVALISKEKQLTFIDELLERKDLHSYACELIPAFGNSEQIDIIKKNANALIIEKSEDVILSDYIEVIVKTFRPEDLPLLRSYYLNCGDASFYRIPVQLYEINKDLFLEAFSLKLKEMEVESICNFDGLLYLTNNIEALEFLIKKLDEEESFKLKKFALKKSKHSMVALRSGLKEKLLELSK